MFAKFSELASADLKHKKKVVPQFGLELLILANANMLVKILSMPIYLLQR